MQAADMLSERGIELEVIDCCSIKPMDASCLERLARENKPMIIVEEGEMIGGFGSEVARDCIERGVKTPAAIIGIENRFVAHGSVDQLLEECGLQPGQIAQRIENVLKAEKE